MSRCAAAWPVTRPLLARRGTLISLGLLLTLVAWAVRSAAADPFLSVTTYHADAARSGHYQAPGLTWAAAAQLARDAEFDGRVPGHVYAQPLYWQPQSAAAGLVIVATEDDVVVALDAATGRTVWQTRLGAPVPGAVVQCSNIDPIGITGTPVIDPTTGTMFLDATVNGPYGPRHNMFGLRLADGAVLPGWPLDIGVALTARGVHFVGRDQNQRAALALLHGRVYLAFAGHAGECGQYHGMVLGVATTPPRVVETWVTRGPKGGIWAPGGISVADGALYFATGNTDRPSVGADNWDDGNGVFRGIVAPQQRDDKRNFFAPADFATLDDGDLDLGGTVPLPIDLPNGVLRLMAMGKDGNAYLLDRRNLGGIGGALVVRRVANGNILTAPVVYRTGGQTLVAYRAPYALCPDGRITTAVVALAVGEAALRPVWCAPVVGQGMPIITTSDADEADPIVWVVGAEGDGRLHGFRGDTGLPVFASDALPGLRHFVAPLVAADRIYIATDGQVFAFHWDGRREAGLR